MRYFSKIVLRVLAMSVLFIGALANAQTPPTVTLTSSVSSGISPVTTTLSWSSTNATACTASGSWTGTKSLSGSQTVTNITANASYTLTCKAADVLGSASLSWVLPTKNTDGSTLTNLAGSRISYGTSATALAQAVQISDPGIARYVVGNLAAGTWYFGIKAYTSTGVESSLSNVTSKVATVTPGQSVSKTVDIAVDTQPLPPVLTLDTQAYEIKPNSTGTLVATRVGLVPLGTTCSDRQQKVGSVTYSLVPRTAVDMVNWPANVKLQEVWARCG